MALVLATVLASSLAACGGGEEGESTVPIDSTVAVSPSTDPEGGSSGGPGSTPPAPGESPSPAPEGTERQQDGEGRPATNGVGLDGGDQPTKTSPPRRGAEPPTDPPTPGFEDTSGQTQIPAFGAEASGDQRAAVEAVLGAYLQASAAREWSRACTYLVASIAGESSAFAKGADGDCAAGLPKVIQLVQSSGREPYFGTAQLSGLRIKEGAGAGFALFHGADGNDYWVGMKVEDGKWRVLSTTPQPLNPTEP